jgi:3-phenylpropionate/cinnamic acid dioxygenase small subunit
MSTTTDKKTAEVQVDLADIIDGDFEGFLDLLVEKAFYRMPAPTTSTTTSSEPSTPTPC